MDRLIDAVNSLSDMDSGWWPFLFLRPEQHQRMTIARVAALAILYGVFAGMVANVALAVAGDAAKVSPFTFPVLTTIGFFALYRATFAACWNIRAARLGPAARASREIEVEAEEPAAEE